MNNRRSSEATPREPVGGGYESNLIGSLLQEEEDNNSKQGLYRVFQKVGDFNNAMMPGSMG